MSSSIDNLPKNENNDSQEIMMVNSILKEIENDDDINVSENTINYAIDESQIPPKINNEIPSKENIEKTAQDIFNSIQNDPQPNIIKVENNPNVENKNEELPLDNQKPLEKLNLINKLMTKIKPTILIFVLFILISQPQVNKLIFKILPKMRNSNGNLSLLGIILKALFISLIYLGSTFYL